MDIDGRTVSLAELRAFVAVADLGGVAQAAQRLRVGQPTVSRSLARLQRRLGVTLMTVGSRSVTLTQAGEVLLRQVRHLPASVDTAVRLTRRASQSPAELRLGVKPDGDAGLLEPLLEQCGRDDRIDCPVGVRFGTTDDLTNQLRVGELDAALLQGPINAAGLDTELLLTEPRLLVTGRSDPLTLAPHLHMRDVQPARLVQWPDVSPRLQRYYRGGESDAPGPDSEQPGPVAHDLIEALRLVELGNAVTVLPNSVTRRYQRDSLAYRPVEGLSPAPLIVAWPQYARSIRVAALIQIASTIAHGVTSTAASDTP